MALIFLEVLIVCAVSSFDFQRQIALTSSLMMSGPNSTNLNPLDYQVWGKCWSLVLTKTATEAKTSSRVLKCTLVNLVCLNGESH